MKKFENINDFFEFLPEDERTIVDALREIILQSIPEVKEKFSYNVPYFFSNRRICYIWPGSIPWGKVDLHGVTIGFCYGYLLNNDLKYLEIEGRKQVATKTFMRLEDINEALLRKYLFEAYAIDQEW